MLSTSFVQVCLELANFCSFDKDTPFLSIPSIVFPGRPSVWVALKSRFVDEDADLEVDRVTVDAWSDHTGSHAGSQVLGEVDHRLGMCSCDSTCQVVYGQFSTHETA